MQITGRTYYGGGRNMKYRIDGPAYLGAPNVWEIIQIETTRRICSCYTEEDATKIWALLEGKTG